MDENNDLKDEPVKLRAPEEAKGIDVETKAESPESACDGKVSEEKNECCCKCHVDWQELNPTGIVLLTHIKDSVRDKLGN